MALDEAVKEAVDSCISDGILAEFLKGHRAEVIDVVLTEYDETGYIAYEKKISHEEGRSEGRNEGRSEGENRFAGLIQKLLAAGRVEDLQKASEDAAYREKLYQEFGL